jgi:inorganic pyrophosphatase
MCSRATRVERIRERPEPTVIAMIKCIVEIPKGSRNKYEYDPEAGGIKLDRFLSSSVVYPTDYGFIPDTCALDGDALDALICVSEPTFPGCIVFCKPIGLFEMEDEHGVDSKVLCVPCKDPGWNSLENLDDLPTLLRNEIAQFFAIYKDLEPGKESHVKGWRDRDAALAEIDSARERFGCTE